MTEPEADERGAPEENRPGTEGWCAWGGHAGVIHSNNGVSVCVKCFNEAETRDACRHCGFEGITGQLLEVSSGAPICHECHDKAAELDRRSAIEAVITLVLTPREQIIIGRRFGFSDLLVQGGNELSANRPDAEPDLGQIDWRQCPHVERDPEIMSGAWCFEGTRLPVSTLFINLASGLTIPEILEQFPNARTDHIKAVLEWQARRLSATSRR